MKTADKLNHIKEYYFSRKLKEVRTMISEGKDVINMGIGSPDLAPHHSVIQSIVSGMDDAQAHKYQSYQGLPEFRQAIASFYSKTYGVKWDSNKEIIPLMGSKEGIMHISMAFLNPGDAVLVPNPGYPTYRSVAALNQAEIMTYDLMASAGYQPDFEALEKMDLARVKIMWVNYPHMPTGAAAQISTFKKLIEFGKKHKILIVNDNPYSLILNENPLSIFNVPEAKETALELNSLSKSHNMAGWRVGFLTGNSELLQQVMKVKTQMDSGMFYGIQKGAIAALNLDKTWTQNLNKIYKKRRDWVWKLADKLNCEYDTHAVGLFVWAKLPQNILAETMTDNLLKQQHIFVAPGTVFGEQGEGYIRFSLCLSEDRIKEAIKRIK